MRMNGYVNLADIIVDFKLPLNPATLTLVEYLMKGGEMAPIHLQPCTNRKGQFRVRGGRHRYVAAKLLGWTKIPARWSTKTDKWAH